MEESFVIDECFFKNDTAWPPFQYASRQTHHILGTLLGAVGITGVLGNTLVLVVFTRRSGSRQPFHATASHYFQDLIFRFRRLRGPVSCLIVNLAVADLSTSLLHVMVVVSSFKGKWSFGHSGCLMYAFGVGYFGMMSIFTLAAISVERYMVITSKPLSNWKMTRKVARKICAASWVYSAALTLPPFFGWSEYTVEGLLTSCSWDYKTQSFRNTSFYIYLLTFGFVVPVFVITFCYTFIIAAVLAHGREMATVKMSKDFRLGGHWAVGTFQIWQVATMAGSSTQGSRKYRPNSKGSHYSAIKTGETILMLIASFMISWTPYAVITFIGQFLDPTLVTPWASTLAAFFAKMSVIYNPIVYGLSHPHFQSSVKQYLVRCRRPAASQDQPMAQFSTPANHKQHFRCFPMKQTEETPLDTRLAAEQGDIRHSITTTNCIDSPGTSLAAVKKFKGGSRQRSESDHLSSSKDSATERERYRTPSQSHSHSRSIIG